MNPKLKVLLVFITLASIFSSCRVFNPSVMLRTKKSYPYAQGVDTVPAEYIIQPGDLINFRLFSKEGFKIIDLTSIEDGTRNVQNYNVQNTFQFLVESDSMLNLPIIGRTKVAGFNRKEAELYLEDKFSNYYNEPYVILGLMNRRITVFPGQGGDAKVIPIVNEYITIVEALALAGGISQGGKAHKVKVFRGSLKEPQVFFINMSTAQGLAAANTHYIRANDIIYVEPSYFAGKQILSTTGQVLGVISSLILTYLLVVNFTSNN
ncbi:MAG: polysaccharide biosynthesis/export family protein [Flavobacteriales bacterium]